MLWSSFTGIRLVPSSFPKVGRLGNGLGIYRSGGRVLDPSVFLGEKHIPMKEVFGPQVYFAFLKDIGLYFYSSTILTSTDVCEPLVGLGLERREEMETTHRESSTGSTVVLPRASDLNCRSGLYEAPQF